MSEQERDRLVAVAWRLFKELEAMVEWTSGFARDLGRDPDTVTHIKRAKALIAEAKGQVNE